MKPFIGVIGDGHLPKIKLMRGLFACVAIVGTLALVPAASARAGECRHPRGKHGTALVPEVTEFNSNEEEYFQLEHAPIGCTYIWMHDANGPAIRGVWEIFGPKEAGHANQPSNWPLLSEGEVWCVEVWEPEAEPELHSNELCVEPLPDERLG